MATLIADVKNFVNRKVLPSVEYFDKHHIYPAGLIEIMKTMGLFGLTIPKIYGGLEVDPVTRFQIIEELASGWVSLCFILDSHLRVCDYIINFGTSEQKTKFLPLLAKGKLISAHANNERNMKVLESFETNLTNINDAGEERWILSGRKEWVSNARNADIFAVSARIIRQDSDLQFTSSCVVLVEKNAVGLIVGSDWNRMGVKGMSLAPVIFRDCSVETKNIIGQFIYDGRTLIESSNKNLSMISSARAIAICKKLIEKCATYLLTKKRNNNVGSLSEEPVVLMRFGELIQKFHVVQSSYNDCCSNYSIETNQLKFIACKIFATETVKEVSLLCMQLFGGSGYTSEYEIERYVRDTLALTIIHSPTDISLTGLGKIALNGFKLKKQQPESIVLHYASRMIPYIKEQFLLQTTLEEQEKIVNTGFYRDTHIQIFLYDMTTLNPSATFKDFLGCLTFAYCLQNNISCICAQSSGNTAMSFIHYARKNPNIKLIQFYLTANSYKINPAVIPDNVTLVEVNSTESEMKCLLKRFSEITDIPIMPNSQLQMDANKIRAYFLTDYSSQSEIYFNWYVQSISSAYGPIGLYQGFKDIEKQQTVPKFLAIQQEAVCPFARALGYIDEDDKKVEIIEPTLFRTHPGELIDRVKNILETYGGKIRVLTNDDFQLYLNEAIDLLLKNNIKITKTMDGNILEKAGILALAATLHEINDENGGAISAHQNVLVGITGGTACPPTGKAKPKLILNEHSTDDDLKLILTYV